MNSIMKITLISIIISIQFSKLSSFKLNFNDLIEYLDEEKSILESFDKYLSSEENRIFRLRQTYERFRQQNSIALKDKELFLSHPNDVYFLIKRIVIEWKTAEELIEQNNPISYQFLNKILSIDQDKFNFSDSIESYDKLMFYYGLNIKSAANGLIDYTTGSGDQKVFKWVSNQTFDAFDCYSIGKQSFSNKDYFAAKEWFEEGFTRSNNETCAHLLANIVEHLSLSHYNLGNINKSIELFHHLLDLSPSRISNKLLVQYMERIAKGEIIEKHESKPVQNTDQSVEDQDPNFVEDEIVRRTDILCQGIKLMNPLIESKLKCFYLNTTLRPYLRLTRIRVEELFKRPQIIQIHNYLSEREVQILKNISIPSLKRLTEVKTQHKTYDFYRIMESRHVFEKDHAAIKNINMRMSEITDLDASEKTGCQFIVSRYYPGGSFNIHHDSSDDPNDGSYGRLLSNVNFLSDVEAGGAFVLPKLNITVFPEKGSGIFFFNEFSSGQNHEGLIHAGCPILYGNKWITNKGLLINKQPKDSCSLDKNSLKVIPN